MWHGDIRISNKGKKPSELDQIQTSQVNSDKLIKTHPIAVLLILPCLILALFYFLLSPTTWSLSLYQIARASSSTGFAINIHHYPGTSVIKDVLSHLHLSSSFSCIIVSIMQDQGPDAGDRGHLPQEDLKMYVYSTCSLFPSSLLCTYFPFILRSDANLYA